MSPKDIVDSILRLLEIVVSWPVILICTILIVRKELPSLLTKLSERLTKAPGGFEFSALQQRVETISAKVEELEKAKFEPSGALTPDLQAHLQSAFEAFQAYLIHLGYKSTAEKVTIHVDPALKDNVYYDNQRIVLGAPLARDTDAFFREYTHHALLSGVDYAALSEDQRAVESGLADYFPCSFNHDPLFGEKSIHLFRKYPGMAKKKAIRVLNNHRKFTEAAAQRGHHDVGEIWGGVLWELRGILGIEAADQMAFSAWEAMLPIEKAGNFKLTFAKQLTQEARKLTDGDQSSEVVEVLKRRGLKV